ncbi:MAG: phosphatase PAP2 family protein [Sphingobacteriales bacterium]|nr:MAG: phosphatase PAP2 family protein [Sphingobacteriales bacterium]
MAELKNFRPDFSARANAYFFASESFWENLLDQKIFEYNIHLDPPMAARIYAAASIATHDGFIACWDAKYAYWGIRPDQYDTSYKPMIGTPPFPGYPSGHAALSATAAGVYAHFFPADRVYFQKRARDAAESRFHAGIHFRSDNEAGLELGAKVAQAIVERLK